MASSLRPVRTLVWSTALLLTAVALAGCHDLPNTFSDNGLDPGGDPADPQDPEGDDGNGDEEDELGDDGQDTQNDDGGDDGGGDGGGDGGDDGGDDGGGDGGNGEDGNEDEGEEDGNGTDEEVPAVEEGDFEEDHVVEIASSLTTTCPNEEFDPQTLEIEPGETVRWANNGSCSHTATSGEEWGEGDGLFDTGSISAGEESENSYRFNESGTYKYYCNFHADMEIAEIVVS